MIIPVTPPQARFLIMVLAPMPADQRTVERPTLPSLHITTAPDPQQLGDQIPEIIPGAIGLLVLINAHRFLLCW